MKNFFLLTVSIFFLFSCGNKDMSKTNNDVSEKQIIATTLPPLKWLVQKVAGNDYEVISILNPQMGHSQTEPNPKDIKKLNDADILFFFGTLSIEETLINSSAHKDRISNVLWDIDDHLFVQGHSHENDFHENNSDDSIDPHVWLSLDILKAAANNIKDELSMRYPYKKQIFEKNYNNFIVEIDSFKEKINIEIAEKKDISYIIYHPTIDYFIRDYPNLHQIVIEQDGKEPSVKYIKSIIDAAKSQNVKTIFIQPQFPKESAEVIARETGNADIIIFNPDEEDVLKNIQFFVDSLK